MLVRETPEDEGAAEEAEAEAAEALVVDDIDEDDDELLCWLVFAATPEEY